MAFIKTSDPISPRLSGYDYSTPGFYLITICTFQKPGERYSPSYLAPRRDFDIVQSIITEAWDALPGYYSNLAVHERIIMPNYVHFLLQLRNPQQRNVDISKVLGRFKGRTSLFWRKWYERTLRKAPPEHLWEKSFYDLIIADKEALAAARNDILHHPAEILSKQKEEANERIKAIMPEKITPLE